MRKLKIKNRPIDRSDLLERYYLDIATRNLFTPEEEVVLLERIQLKDETALNRLVEANLLFVISIAEEYQNQGLSLLDLINEGSIGLIKAAREFDASKESEFNAYAYSTIRDSICDALAKFSRTVRLTPNSLSSIEKLTKNEELFLNTFGRKPGFKEISLALKFPLKKTRFLSLLSQKELSGDSFIDEDEKKRFFDEFSTNNTPDYWLQKESVDKAVRVALNTLTPIEIHILKRFYGVSYERRYSLKEIADLFGLTITKVRNIKKSAILRTRKKCSLMNFLKEQYCD